MAAKLSVNMKTGRIPSFMNTGKDAKVFIKTQEGYTSVYMNTGGCTNTSVYTNTGGYTTTSVHMNTGRIYKCKHKHRKDIQVYI